MSQIDTGVTALLDNEADPRAVFTCVSGAGELHQVLARLDTRQQALILPQAQDVYGTRAEFSEVLGARRRPCSEQLFSLPSV